MLNRLQGVFESLQKNNVEYVVLGGIAAILYGVPRATFDLDILINPTLANANALLRSLEEAGLGSATMTSAVEILATEITIFNDFIRIDVQTSTPGITFAKAWADKNIMHYNHQAFFVLSREHLIMSKKAAGRDIDLQDVVALKSLPKNRN